MLWLMLAYGWYVVVVVIVDSIIGDVIALVLSLLSLFDIIIETNVLLLLLFC